MKEERLESVKKEIRSVIITYPNGVTITNFIKAYKQLIGSRFPTREFGYFTDLDFLQSLPDVVHVQVDRNGDYQLKCVADETTEHIQKLVVKQKTVKSKSQRKSYSIKPEKIYAPFKTKPFISAALRENLFIVLSDFPDGLSYNSLLLAYKKKLKNNLNLDFLSDNNNEKLDKVAEAVPEIEVKMINDVKRIFYSPPDRKKLNNDFELDVITKKIISNKSIQHEMKDTKIDKIESSFKKQLSSSNGTYENVINTNGSTVKKDGSLFTNNNVKEDGISEISAIPRVVRNDFEKVLKKYPDGVLAKHFPFLYESITGNLFDILDFGFNNFIELADALPDIFLYVKSQENLNDWVLFHPHFSENANRLKEKNKAMELAELKQITLKNKQKVNPSDIVAPTSSYFPPQFPTDINLSLYIPVFLSFITNPSCFWFKLQTSDVVSRFREMEEELQCFYHSSKADEYIMPTKDINIGSTCVAMIEDHWYRVTVTSSPNDEFVNIYFVDYGGWERTHCSNLRYLKYKFFTLPSQVFKAQLAKVQPAKGNKLWSRRAEVRFQQLCSKSHTLSARIFLEFEDFVSVFLCDTSGGIDIHINDTLLDEGLAEDCLEDFSQFPIESSENSEMSDELEADIKHISSVDQNNRNQLRLTRNQNEEIYNNQKLVKRITLGDGIKIHLILLFKQLYITAAELCNLFWPDKSHEVLKERLEFKNIDIPTKTILSSEQRELFYCCENESVKGFEASSQPYSVILYPLLHVMKVLNTLGHPSVKIRQTITILLENFDPDSTNWGEISTALHDDADSLNRNEDINTHCLYDLQALYEAVKCKRMTLLNFGETQSDTNSKELKKIEMLSEKLKNRIEFIKSICSSY